MQTTKKKPNILLIVLGAVLASYLGYLVAGAGGRALSLMLSWNGLRWYVPIP